MLEKNNFKKNDNKLFNETLKGINKSKTPIWFMRQAGRYLPEYREVRNNVNNFMEFCYNPKLASKVTLQPIDRFDFDAAIIFSDILVIPDALGLDVSFVKGQGPIVKGTSDDLSKLKFNINKLNPVYEAIELARSNLSTEKTLIGFAGCPWTLATYIIEGGSSRDFIKTKELAYSNPSYFNELINILTESIIEHLIEQVKAGAEVLQIFDSWSGVLTESQFNKWTIEPAKKIVNGVKSVYPEIPIIGFPKGAGTLYKDYSIKTGVDAISFDQNMSRKWICDNVDIPVQGNLDPVLLASNKDEALKEVANILDCFKGKAHIFNLGHGILPHTPIENVESVIEFIRSYGN